MLDGWEVFLYAVIFSILDKEMRQLVVGIIAYKYIVPFIQH